MKLDLGVVSVATRDYIHYWMNMVLSSELIIQRHFNLTFYVFTDQPNKVEEFKKSIDAKVRVFPINSLGWPEATLLRFEIISSHYSELVNDYLMYIDADMIIKSEFDIQLKNKLLSGNMVLVRHPGFFRPKGIKLLLFYIEQPEKFLHDLVMFIRTGGLGSWEENKESFAYVPRRGRNNYFCGGIWFGERAIFRNLCWDLREKVNEDLKRSYIAKWHDESHLNCWASKNRIEILTPAYCFDPSYRQLKDVSEIVEAVDKHKIG